MRGRAGTGKCRHDRSVGERRLRRHPLKAGDAPAASPDSKGRGDCRPLVAQPAQRESETPLTLTLALTWTWTITRGEIGMAGPDITLS
ncbi:hypothetical protein ABMA09_03100 [Erwinia rhapontici]